LKIRLYYDNIKFRVKGAKRIKEFLEKVIRDKNKIPGDLIFIFTNDIRIREINKEFLNHDYFTDVISFDYCCGRTLNGEIYISIDTLRDNSKIYKVKTSEEVLRIMLHGTLHLLGYVDSNESDRSIMMAEQEKRVIEFVKGK